MSAPRLVALDALRGIAILAVLLFHFYRPTGHAPLDLVLAPFATAGWAGVDVFFVLSGYLVGGIVLDDAAHPAGFDWHRFLVRRALRLWPVLYLYLGTLVLAGYDPRALWPAFVHLQNYADHAPSHLWSLAVEEHFYLAAAIALPWLVRTAPARIVPLLAATIVAAGALRIGALALGEPPRFAQWQTQFRIDALAVGVLLAALRRYHPRVFIWLVTAHPYLWTVVGAGFAFLACDPPDVIRWGPGLVVAWLMGAALVLLALGFEVAAADRLRPFAHLGLIAYPLYIWHPGIGQVAATIADAAGIIAPATIIGIKLSAAILGAWLIHRLVEAPFLALRDRPPRPDGHRLPTLSRPHG